MQLLTALSVLGLIILLSGAVAAPWVFRQLRDGPYMVEAVILVVLYTFVGLSWSVATLVELGAQTEVVQ